MREFRQFCFSLAKRRAKVLGCLALVTMMGLFYLRIHTKPYHESQNESLERVNTRSKFTNLELADGNMAVGTAAYVIKSKQLNSHKEERDLGVSSGNRFVLGLNYWEQFNMATSNLLKLVCLAAQWNARTVQPFTLNSRLYGLKYFKPDDKNMDNPSIPEDINLIYDIASLNSMLNRHSLPSLAVFRDFLQHAERDLIVIHFVAGKEAHELPVMKGQAGTFLHESFKKESIVDCKNFLVEFPRRISYALSLETSEAKVAPFRITKYFCVNMSHLTTPEQLASKIGFDLAESFSILVVNWRGTSDKKYISASATGLHLNNRILMANACHTEILLSEETVITHSNAVLNAARKYLEHLDLGDYIAVHVRSEKLGLREPRMPGSTKQCLLEGLRVKDEIQAATSNLSTLFVTDYGPYSTDTCRACKARRTMEDLLKEYGITPVHYEPNLMGDPTDSGFAAAVEMNLLAHSTYLVLVGGGAFQNQAALRLAKVHEGYVGDLRLFHICVDDRSVKTLAATSTLSSITVSEQ